MTGLVKTDGKTAFTTSLIIAKGVELEHRAVLQLIRKYTEEINEGGSSAFQMRRIRVKNRGGNAEFFELDEEQTIFLIALMKNSEIVVKFKRQLAKEFIQQKKIIAALIHQQKDDGWVRVRENGKIAYNRKTDMIKEFVEYAKAQGSQNSERYYTNMATMENKALFVFEEHFKNMREVQDIRQLLLSDVADGVIEKALKDGMDKQLSYKDCFQLAKTRIIAFVEIAGSSTVLSFAIGAPQ